MRARGVDVLQILILLLVEVAEQAVERTSENPMIALSGTVMRPGLKTRSFWTGALSWRKIP
jgi:hypothetical protein